MSFERLTEMIFCDRMEPNIPHQRLLMFECQTNYWTTEIDEFDVVVTCG